jgi:hypothetical protein
MHSWLGSTWLSTSHCFCFIPGVCIVDWHHPQHPFGIDFHHGIQAFSSMTPSIPLHVYVLMFVRTVRSTHLFYRRTKRKKEDGNHKKSRRYCQTYISVGDQAIMRVGRIVITIIYLVRTWILNHLRNLRGVPPCPNSSHRRSITQPATMTGIQDPIPSCCIICWPLSGCWGAAPPILFLCRQRFSVVAIRAYYHRLLSYTAALCSSLLPSASE